jgi:hypothetical protein
LALKDSQDGKSWIATKTTRHWTAKARLPHFAFLNQ